jgi:hypothetical protein
MMEERGREAKEARNSFSKGGHSPFQGAREAVYSLVRPSRQAGSRYHQQLRVVPKLSFI